MGIMESRLIHGTVGFAIGDALGLPVKGQSQADLAAAPVTTMKGYGTFNQPAGTYSDETGLTLAGLDALQSGFDQAKLIAPYGKRNPDIWPSVATALTTGKAAAAPNEPGALIRALPFAFLLIKHLTQIYSKKQRVVVSFKTLSPSPTPIRRIW